MFGQGNDVEFGFAFDGDAHSLPPAGLALDRTLLLDAVRQD
jgi:hypothetical protein